ncbi:restriction endonuclease subunit S [Corallococcus sp. CA041A]|uniref:restriction endonuclease subunit S n=1 Tax=Corallococcus sp. CA041A TaxID=2316727 RepID=UPI0013157889|nr:restriction endonuclease subunit S [Corallococcus sp. CA041A]
MVEHLPASGASNWPEFRIGELGQVEAGRQRNPNAPGTPRPYLRVANVYDGRLDLSDVLEMPFTDNEFERFRLHPGDILLNEGQSLQLVGRCSLYRGEPVSVAFQNSLIRFRAGPNVETEFAFQLFRHLQYSGVFSSVATQTTSIAHLGVSRFASIPVRIPPLPEQRKIAAILSSVDETIVKTEAVIAQLEVVKKALIERLLARGMPGRHVSFKQTEAGALPSSWHIVRLSEVAEVRTGLSKNSKRALATTVELPYLRVANVQDGHLDLDEVKTIAVEASQVERFLLHRGDVLFCEGGDADKVGRGTVWRGELPLCLHQNHVFAVRPTDAVLPEFLSIYRGSSRGKAYFLDAAKQTTNLASINSTQLRALPLPLPPIEEQQEIVAIVVATADRISIQRRSLKSLQSIKTALLDALLSGRIRMNPVAQEAA